MAKPGGLRAVGMVWALGGLAMGCAADKGGGELHAKRAVLEREVAGLRASVAKLERGEPLFPEEAVVVAISEGVAKELVNAQLPIAVELETFKVDLTGAEAAFKGSPLVHLTGTLVHKDHPGYVGEVSAIGALEKVQADPSTGTLRAEIAIDHVELLKMGGLERFLSGGAVDELARTVRKQLPGHLPKIQIPVKIEQTIELPSVTEGPVRLEGASMPLAVGVTDVVVSQGLLWIAIRVTPGELVKTARGSRP